ncbi:MAG TPA: alpha/beta hydrolase [Tepidisphaeraceae bacterium]|nr:alpha/beta hydrolase [Tepidisphaeraceae bacterium]
MPGSYFMLALMILLMGALASAIAVTIMAFAILCPPRFTDGIAVWRLKRLSPGDLGLPFEDVQFNIRDQRDGRPLRLVGWWMPRPARGPHGNAAPPAGQGRCVVVLHDYGQAKVSVIEWAPLWHSLGFNILAIDHRAHGESEGRYCTGGYWERHDVDQALDQLRAQRAADTMKLVLFGIGLGAAVAVAAGVLREDVSAIVLANVPDGFPVLGTSHLALVGSRDQFRGSMPVWLAQKIADCDFAAVSPPSLLHQIKCPVLALSLPSDDDISKDQGSIQQLSEFMDRHLPSLGAQATTFR